MWEHRRLLITGGVAAGLLLVAATATLGVLVGRAASDELRADLDAAIQAQRLLGARDATIAQLEGRVMDLDAEVEGVRAERDVATRDLVRTEGELEQLTKLIAGGENTSLQLAELESSYKALQGDYAELRSEHDALVTRFADFVPIETAELSTDALYLDRAVREVAVTRPLCTGSMEPTDHLRRPVDPVRAGVGHRPRRGRRHLLSQADGRLHRLPGGAVHAAPHLERDQQR